MHFAHFWAPRVHQRDPRIQNTCPGEGKHVTSLGPKLQPTNYNWQIANSKMKYETSKMHIPCTCRWKLEDAIVDGTFVSTLAAWWPLKGPADICNICSGFSFSRHSPPWLSRHTFLLNSISFYLLAFQATA